jgi:hypothetical protein
LDEDRGPSTREAAQKAHRLSNGDRPPGCFRVAVPVRCNGFGPRCPFALRPPKPYRKRIRLANGQIGTRQALLRKVAVSSGTVFEEAGILKRRMLGLATVSLVVGIAVASAVSALAAGDHDLEDGWLRPAVAGGLTPRPGARHAERPAIRRRVGSPDQGHGLLEAMIQHSSYIQKAHALLADRQLGSRVRCRGCQPHAAGSGPQGDTGAKKEKARR